MSERKRPSDALEPIFNHHANQFSLEALSEWLAELAKKNSKDIKAAHMYRDCFKNGDAAKYIFLICETLKVPLETKYMAVEIFSRFMLRHIGNLFKHVRRLGRRARREWRDIHDRVSHQVFLRMVSSCQIASKITAHSKVVTALRARRYMEERGYHYSMDSVLESEMRVLKTLEFNVTLTPPNVYIETLLEILGHLEGTLSLQQYYCTALQLLDLAYLCHKEVYRTLYSVVAHRPDIAMGDKEQFCSVKADKMLLASAIISASVFAEDKQLSQKVMETLSQITGIPRTDILDFSTVFVHMVIARK